MKYIYNLESELMIIFGTNKHLELLQKFLQKLRTKMDLLHAGIKKEHKKIYFTY